MQFRDYFYFNFKTNNILLICVAIAVLKKCAQWDTIYFAMICNFSLKYIEKKRETIA